MRMRRMAAKLGMGILSAYASAETLSYANQQIRENLRNFALNASSDFYRHPLQELELLKINLPHVAISLIPISFMFLSTYLILKEFRN